MRTLRGVNDDDDSLSNDDLRGSDNDESDNAQLINLTCR